ncbi:MAG: T9SS type A sorting domain-containing protein [Breznakibacter sp.]|nr:T9SS type A sorting domain-containing protein [Breznakibacter sp.]
MSYSGFVNSETASSLTTQPTASSTAVTNSTVGNYDVVASGGVSDKYEFSYTKGVLTVTQADLNIKANNKSRDYGTANPAFDFTYSGFIFGESVANLTTLPTASCSATASSAANSYAITPSGAAATNYAITYTNGTLTINKVPLLITAEDKTRNTGEANPTFTFTYSGFVAGDDASDLLTQPSAICAASELSPAGDYPIIPNGATSNNYNILITNGTLTVLLAMEIDKLGVAEVSVTPNPSTGLFKIEGVEKDSELHVVVRDITGNIIVSSSETVLDLTSKANGIYIVSVNANGVTKVFKVVKK